METVKSRSLVRLSDTDLILADPDEDILGRKVIDKTGEEIGQVESLFIDEDERRVRFLELGSGGRFGFGGETRLIPTDAIWDITEESVVVGTSRDVITASPAYDPNLRNDEQYWVGLYGYYGYPPYWSQS
jgi:sporulation protein YlmC with PRC-barrel domain